jgi:hypothetical protein
MLGMRQKTIKNASATIIAMCASLMLLAGCGTIPAGNQAPADRVAAATVQRTEAGDFAGKKLLLVGYLHDGSFIPLEPGHGSNTNIVFAADGTISGYSGFRDFSGTWKAGKPGANGTRTCSIVIYLPKSGSPSGQIDAISARFEKDYFNDLAATKKIQKEKDFIRLLGSRDEVLLRFMFADALTQD